MVDERDVLEKLHQRLLALHPASRIAEDDEPWWVSDAIIARLLREAVVLRPDPRRVLCNVGVPLECHTSALRGGKLYGVETVGGTPYFGFKLIGDYWWCHSFVITGTMVIGSLPFSLPSPPFYFAMPYDVEIFRMLWPEEKDVPVILTNKERQHDHTTHPRNALIPRSTCDGPC